jgi:hypothetical protein
MSLTSYRAAPPRAKKAHPEKALHYRSGGEPNPGYGKHQQKSKRRLAREVKPPSTKS